MKLEQAARQALEALESCNVGNWSMAFDEFAVVEAITALREALAEQAEQEPVAWMNKERNTITWNELYPNMTPLYAAPVRTKDLTDDEIAKVLDSLPMTATHEEIIRAVIAADREKNRGTA